MGLHNWIILSKNAEQKQTRNNLKKLGCLFEAFIGAFSTPPDADTCAPIYFTQPP